MPDIKLDPFVQLVALHDKVSNREHALFLAIVKLCEDAMEYDHDTVRVDSLLSVLKAVYPKEAEN